MERPPDERPPEQVSKPASEPDDVEPQRETDLLTIGLLVFFLALIGIVGALLVVPALV